MVRRITRKRRNNFKRSTKVQSATKATLQSAITFRVKGEVFFERI